MRNELPDKVISILRKKHHNDNQRIVKRMVNIRKMKENENPGRAI